MSSELVEGERFATVEPTPRLVRCIEAAAAVIRRAAPELVVISRAQISFGESTSLVPSLVVVDGSAGSSPPRLVVEFRTESTSRYILGPKRLAYSRHAVPELWFVDPWRSRIATLQPHDGGPYGWPPTEHLPGETIVPRTIPGARLAVSELLGGWPPTQGREPDPGEEWWEAS